jgi:hypothetical protein
MPTPRPEPIVRRAELLLGGLSLAALILGAYAVLRPPVAAPNDAAAELAELREEVAALRHSLAVTRSQQSAPGTSTALADVERRLARIETTRAPGPASAARSDAAAAPTTDEAAPMPDGSPRYVGLTAPSGAVAVEQLADGSLVVKNRDPGLSGTSMLVKARTADGRDEDVTITVPPPG